MDSGEMHAMSLSGGTKLPTGSANDTTILHMLGFNVVDHVASLPRNMLTILASKLARIHANNLRYDYLIEFLKDSCKS